jgi:inner membrane protein
LPRRLSVRARTSNRWQDSLWRGAVVVLIFIFALDAVSRAVTSSTAEIGVFDEPAHLATAGLLLFALIALYRRVVPVPFLAAALIASVAIDLDHVPQYLGWHGLTEGAPRPYTHSLVAPVILLLVAVAVDSHARQVALGAAFGVSAHLFRDLATASGVALFWPVSSTGVRLPYLLYAAGLLSLAAAVAALSLARGQRRDRVKEPIRDTG